MRRVLFVCLGNICRSPLAWGAARRLLLERGLDGRIEVDSAGTGSWHVGEPADPRMRETARRYGIDLSEHRARQVRFEDFDEFDLIVAMDRQNLEDLRAMAPHSARRRIRLLREWDPEGGQDVPDPYYGGPRGFEQVHEIVSRSVERLIDELAAECHRKER